MLSSDHRALPSPDETAKAHSEQLHQCIDSALAKGVVSFADYMQMALYEPGLGYYMAGAQKFGAGGDFITAPEVSSLFGQCLSIQCGQILSTLGGGNVLELGAGSGRLALDILNAMAEQPPENYFILEPSAELRQRQMQMLRRQLAESLFNRLTWLETLPKDFVGVCIANEVMDALPVELFTRNEKGVQQLCVSRNDAAALAFVERDAPAFLGDAIRDIESELGTTFVSGYRSEYCALLGPWVTALSQAMKKGVLLLSDYGYPRSEYYLPERAQGSLGCYYQHHFHDDVFFHPGLQDLTAHVDFTRVIEAGSEAGLALLGYTSQTGFLLDTGISEIAAERMQACQSEPEQLTLAKQIKTLTLPAAMGERFQFMALGKNYASSLAGFASQDLSYRL